MLDWLRHLFGNSKESSKSDSKGLRKVKSMPALTSRSSASGKASSSSRGKHSRSSSSLKNETMMLEAQRLFLSMGLALTTTKNAKRRDEDDEDDVRGDRSHYRNLDIIYHHPQGNGRVFVGNDRAASNLAILQKNKITHIVNCTRPARAGTLANHHQNNARYKYYEFPVACWNEYVLEDDRGMVIREDNKKMLQLMKFLKPMFMFIKRAVLQGNNVLIHCLAGAHRAGTTGILTLMYFMKLSAEDAQKLAIKIRPIINPISDFPDLLELYEKCQRHKVDKDDAGVKRERNVSYSLTSVQDLSGSQLQLGHSSRPNVLVKTLSLDNQDGVDATTNKVAAMLAKKSNSAIADSLTLGRNASKELNNPDARLARKKNDSRRRRSLDSCETAKAAAASAGGGDGSGVSGSGGGISSWLKYQQKTAKEESVTLPAIAGASDSKEGAAAGGGGKPKVKSKDKRKSRRSFDPEASTTKISGADAAKMQLRRGSLGALPTMGL